MVTVCIPATSANLGPGFDTLGLALSLYNYVEMEIGTRGLEIEIEGQGSLAIPRGKENIVYQGALKVWEQCGFDPQGVRIKLRNNIPLARGLGSSAAAITGGILAANALAGYPLSDQEILHLATQIEGHPDNVAPALFGGLVISTMEDGTVYSHKISVDKELQTGVVIPEFPLATKKGRGILPKQVSLEDAVFNVSRTAFLMTAFLENRFDLLKYGMQDRLHQPYRSQLVPGMETAFQRGLDAGAQGVALSGSGPTLIAFGSDNTVDAVCKEMLSAFTEQGIEASIMKLLPDNKGARVIDGGHKIG